jgi:hypothetical protein
MKKVVAGTLLVVLSCWTLLNNVTTIVDAAATPPQPLTTVAHDNTLKGSGTTADPLGVAAGGIGTTQLANGAVTLPKISISGTATAGSVLGTNGTGLVWQAASSGGSGGGARVVDSAGHSYPLGPAPPLPFFGAVWQTGGLTFAIPLNRGAIYETGVARYYTSGDCSGTAYLQSSPGYIPSGDARELLVQLIGISFYTLSNTLFYPGTFVASITANSADSGPGTGCSSQPNMFTGPVNVALSASLSSAFVPPFSVQLN